MSDKNYSKQIRQANFMANPRMCAQMELTRALLTHIEECGIERPGNFMKFQWVNALKVQYWSALVTFLEQNSHTAIAELVEKAMNIVDDGMGWANSGRMITH